MVPKQMDAITSGVIVFFDTHPTAHRRLHNALDRIQLAELCPPPYSVGESLKRAMADYAAQHRKKLIEDLENKSKVSLKVIRHESANDDGYEIVAVEHGKEKNHYHRLVSAKVEVSGSFENVVITDGWRYVESTSVIQQCFETNRLTVSASAVGQMLVKAVKLLNGTCVREIGGTYYCPDGCQDDWKMLCEAVEEENGTQITWHEIVMNQSSSRAIQRAIHKEITGEVNSITEEIASGALGMKAIDNRILRLRELMGKAAQYEGILSTPLEDVRKALEDAETAAATASMLAAAKSDAEAAQAA
jgi:hypothetical protein